MSERPDSADHLDEDDSFLTPEHVDDETETPDDPPPGGSATGLGVPSAPD